MTGLHPDAARSFDERAERLLAALPNEMPPDNAVREAFVPPIAPAASLTDADIVGIVRRGTVNADGRETARLTYDGIHFALFAGDNYAALSGLAKSIRKTPSFRSTASERSIVDWITEWALGRRAGTVGAQLTTYVETRLKEAVAVHRYLIPIHEPYVETRFQLGSVEFRPLTSDELEIWVAAPDHVAPVLRAKIEASLAQRKKLLEARTVAVVEVEAEQGYAAARAWEKAEIATSMLRLLSKGMFYPSSRSNCVPLGIEVAERQQYFAFKNGGFVGWHQQVMDPESMPSWAMNRKEIEHNTRYWEQLGALCEGEGTSAFDEDLLRSLLVYSRVALSRVVSEKLIHLFASVESLLLRNESEPIQASISERVAFATGRTPEERAEIAHRMKAVYGLRSRFVHHGNEPDSDDDLATVKAFLANVWAFYFQLVHARAQFKSRDDFLAAIERRKWQ